MFNAVSSLVLLVLGALGLIMWWEEFGMVLRGLIPFLFIIGGLVAMGSYLTAGKTTEADDDSKENE